MNAINKGRTQRCFFADTARYVISVRSFATDMYLPSLPAMADYFSASCQWCRWGLTTSMIGLALGQIFSVRLAINYGEASAVTDFGMLIVYRIHAVLSFLPDIYSFVTLRLMQGIGGQGEL